MTKLTGYNLGPPFKGMATQIDPVVAASQGYLADAVNVTYDEVTAKPIPKLMQEVAQVPDYSYLLYYHYGFGWITDKVRLADGTYNWGVRGARSKDGYTVSYVTQTLQNGTYAPPKKYIGISAPVTLGIPAPVTQPTATNGAGGNITIAYTYVNFGITGDDEVESNRSPLYPTPGTATTLKNGGTVTFAWPSPDNTRVTAVRIYATQDGDPNGTLYFVGQVTGKPGTTTFSLASVNRDTARPLDWGPNGYPESDNNIYFDHSPPGNITCLSDKFHGTEANAEDNAGGTLFYAIKNVVGWTETGEPEYFPLVNQYTLSGTVQALVSYGTQTLAFLVDQIWAFSGQHSSAISARQIESRRGVGVGKAKTVISTPYGIVFVSREGLILSDGTRSKIICQEVFREFNDSDHWCAAYADGIYYLCRPATSGNQNWRIDLRNPENIIATKTSIRFFSSHTLASDGELSPDGGIILPNSSVWDSSVTYSSASTVTLPYGSGQRKSKYKSLQSSNIAKDPILRQDYWNVVPDAQVYIASQDYLTSEDDSPYWSSSLVYSQGNVVLYNNKRYESINASSNTNNIPSQIGSTWWQEYLPENIQSYRRIPVCPYTEDPQVNQHASLPMTIQTHPLRLGPINSFNKLRRARVDGVGDATVTISFNAEPGRTYARPVTVSNNSTSRFMLPMSLYGDSFTIKVESTTSFALRQVELEGSTNR